MTISEGRKIGVCRAWGERPHLEFYISKATCQKNYCYHLFLFLFAILSLHLGRCLETLLFYLDVESCRPGHHPITIFFFFPPCKWNTLRAILQLWSVTARKKTIHELLWPWLVVQRPCPRKIHRTYLKPWSHAKQDRNIVFLMKIRMKYICSSCIYIESSLPMFSMFTILHPKLWVKFILRLSKVSN